MTNIQTCSGNTNLKVLGKHKCLKDILLQAFDPDLCTVDTLDIITQLMLTYQYTTSSINDLEGGSGFKMDNEVKKLAQMELLARSQR